jgi:DNA modification methylase
MEHNKILQGNALPILKKLPSESVNCIVTSPPLLGMMNIFNRLIIEYKSRKGVVQGGN